MGIVANGSNATSMTVRPNVMKQNNDVIRKCFGAVLDYTDLLLPHDILAPRRRKRQCSRRLRPKRSENTPVLSVALSRLNMV